MGDDTTIRPPGGPKRKIFRVKKIIVHPNYNRFTPINDIAVLIVIIIIISKYFTLN